MRAASHVNSPSKDDHLLVLHRSLLQAAAQADVSAFFAALDAGADVNAEDPSGRNVVGYAIGGERWQDADSSSESYMLGPRLAIIKALLRHEKISLSVLNAPIDAMRGITPLGLAAWLNCPDIVRILLSECPGLVSVDGMDSSGATPLMYAARDGRAEVVFDLLSFGARPDYRDLNHRSSIQFALKHPQVLWLCECALRRRRKSEPIRTASPSSISSSHSQTPIECHPRLALKPANDDLLDMVCTINSAIRLNNLSQLLAYLLPLTSHERGTAHPPPILINFPDASGRSPIHYCASMANPSVDILDALYHAGADVSLHSRSGEGSPLHCLARNAQPMTPDVIHTFIRHLVVDLRAPLASQDANGETCIHVAAEHGYSADVLAALLACDTTGVVRELRNSRGLTALEIAKSHLKVAFGVNAEIHRCVSSASVRTIKPSTASSGSTDSLFRTEVLRRPTLPVVAAVDMRDSLSELNLQLFPHCILENLLKASRQLCIHENVDVREVEELLHKTEEMGEDLLVQMQTRLNDASTEVQIARRRFTVTRLAVQDIETMVNALESRRSDSLDDSWYNAETLRRRTTDSAGSGWTSVSRPAMPCAMNDVASDCSSVYPHGPSDSGIALPGASCETPLTAATFPPTSPPANWGLRTTRSMVDLRRTTDVVPEDKSFLKMFSSWTKDGVRPRSKTDSQATSAEAAERTSAIWLGDPRDPVASGVSKVKAWLKKKLKHDAAAPTAEARHPGHSTAHRGAESPPAPPVDIDSALRVMRAAHQELSVIQEDIENAERYVDHTNRSIAQAHQLLAKSLDNRRMQCFHAKRLISLQNGVPTPPSTPPRTTVTDTLAFPPVTIPSSPRDSQLVFPMPPSANTSVSTLPLSLSSALLEEDDDVRALRRLITRKIEARTERALEYANAAIVGLRIVKDVTRTLRRNIPS